MNKETGGPAYPTYFTADHAISMTLRDYFAAKTMAVLFDSDSGYDKIERQMIAEEAYAMADAMLKEREK